MCVDYNAIVTFLPFFLFLHFFCTIFVPVILSSTNTFGTSPFDMKRTLILILALVAALSARGQEAVGQKEKYYLGAEASVGGEIAACIVGGVCFSGVDVKLHVLFPLGTKGIAYYNLPIRYGRSREMELMPGNGIELVAGYGIPFGEKFRLTPSAGIRYTSVIGKTTDWSLMEQRSYVFSGLGALKVEYALSPSYSLVVTPGYAVPLGRDAFVRSFETSLPAIRTWYGGLFIHVGIHFKF